MNDILPPRSKEEEHLLTSSCKMGITYGFDPGSLRFGVVIGQQDNFDVSPCTGEVYACHSSGYHVH